MDNVFLVLLSCLVILLASIHASSDSANCFGEYCFTYSGSAVNRSFDGARFWCTNNNSSSLAAVNNKSSQDALYAFLSSSNIQSPLYVNAQVNKDSDSTWFLIGGGKLTGSVENQPSDPDKTYKFYVSLHIPVSSQTFVVWASGHAEERNYICSYGNYAGIVPLNASYSYSGSVYIKYENETLNWFEARNRCYLNGGDLATFHDLNDFSTSWLNSSSSYWIGIRWLNWRWENTDDNQEVIYTNWANGKPNDVSLTCVCVDETSSHSWTDCDCTTPRSFVCSKYIGTSTVTSPTTTLNEPTPFQNKMSVSQTTENNSKTLAIGVGVGVGGGVLIILVIVVIIIVVRKRKSRQGRAEGKPRKERKESKKSTETPAKQPTANTGEYAEILAASQPGPRGSVKKPVVYTTPEFVETK